MATAGTLDYLIKIDSSAVSSGLKNAEGQVKGFGGKMSAIFAKASQAASSFFKDALGESKDFGAAMSQVAATLGKSTKEMGKLSAFARQMGSATAFTATQAAEALNYMALAGYDAETSMKMLPTVLNLAAAGTMELATASDMVTDAQSALGLSVEQTETLVDQMARTSSKTNTSVSQLGDAILTVGGTAKILKGGTTELNTVLGVLANNGIKGSEGGTALRNVILSLTAPTNKAAKALKKLKIDVFDAEGNMRGLPEIMSDINTATKDMTANERINFLNTVFNKRDLKAVEALLGMSIEEWAALGDQIEDSAGAAKKMANTQLDNLAGDVTIFNSALGELKLSLIEGLTPALRQFVKHGTEWVTKLADGFKKKGLSGAMEEAGKMLQKTQKLVGRFIQKIGNRLLLSKNPFFKFVGQSIKALRDGFSLKAVSKIVGYAINGIKDGVKKTKIKIADLLGIENAKDATWTDIAGKIIERIKGGAQKVKVELANLLGLTDENGNPVDDPSDVSWGKIASSIVTKIKNALKNAEGKAMVGLANLLGLTDESGNPVDDPSDTSWGKIAGSVVEKIKNALKTAEGKAKVGLANLLGLTDENGNPVDDPSDVSWGNIAGAIVTKIKNALKNAEGKAKVKLANLLGLTDENGNAVDDPSDTSWSAIGSGIIGKIKEGIGKVKVGLANLLGLTDDSGNAVDDPSDTSWAEIGSKIVEKLKGAIKGLKVKLIDLLGIDDESLEGEGEGSWEDIGRKIVSKITTHFKNKGEFLKELILGGGYKAGESSWKDVGDKISQWVSESFQEGGFLNTFLGEGSGLIAAGVRVAGTLLSGIAKFLGENPDAIVSIIKTIAGALVDAAEPIVSALITILTDEGLWDSLAQSVIKLVVAVVNGVLHGLGLDKTFGKLDADAILRYLGFEPKGNGKGNGEGAGAGEGAGERAGAGAKWEQPSSPKSKRNPLFLSPLFSGTDANPLFVSPIAWLLESLGVSGGSKADETAEGLDDVNDSSQELSDSFGGTVSKAKSFGDASSTTAQDVDQLGVSALSAAELLASIEAPDWANPEGSHAKGLPAVPYDNYIAQLHRGEMVLTASQARKYREGQNSMDTAAFAASVVAAVREGMAGASVNSYLSGKKVTDDTNRRTSNKMRARRFAMA